MAVAVGADFVFESVLRSDMATLLVGACVLAFATRKHVFELRLVKTSHNNTTTTTTTG